MSCLHSVYWLSRLTKTRVIHVSTTAKLSGKIESSPMVAAGRK